MLGYLWPLAFCGSVGLSFRRSGFEVRFETTNCTSRVQRACNYIKVKKYGNYQGNILMQRIVKRFESIGRNYWVERRKDWYGVETAKCLSV